VDARPITVDLHCMHWHHHELTNWIRAAHCFSFEERGPQGV
jgi:hypothetical protein